MRFGSFDVALLVDGEGSFATMAEVFPALASTEPWWLPVNVVLARTGDTTVLVDTGLGPPPREFLPEADVRLLGELARIGVMAGDVDLVVHTHLHVDHVGWDGSFPNARYVVNEDDWSHFMSEESLAGRPHLREKTQPLYDAGLVDLVSGETELLPGVRLVPTPGHTPGHMSIVSHLEGVGQVVRADAGFRWEVFAKEDAAPVE